MLARERHNLIDTLLYSMTAVVNVLQTQSLTLYQRFLNQALNVTRSLVSSLWDSSGTLVGPTGPEVCSTRFADQSFHNLRILTSYYGNGDRSTS